jgi:hypothetical protein
MREKEIYKRKGTLHGLQLTKPEWMDLKIYCLKKSKAILLRGSGGP